MLTQAAPESATPIEKHDSHECRNPRCAKRFIVVYQHDPRRLPLPLHVPCPYCGVRDFLMVGNLGGRQPDGTYVIAFDYRIEASER